MKNTILLLIVSFLFLLFFSCEKDIVPNENDLNRINGSEDPTLIEWNNNGLGIYFGYPSGEQFALPEKVFLYEDKVFNHSFSFPYNNAITNCSFQQYGSDGYKPLFLFIYTELSNCTLKIPGGLIFYTPRDSSQNLFVVKDVFIPLERFNFITINAFCLNNERVNIKGDTYVFGPQTNHPELAVIPSILNDKEDFFDDENRYAIQSIIWNITDGSGKIREEDIAFLESLP